MRALLLLLLALITTVSSAVKVKRVRAGMHYKKHDPVHIVVNKVGCVLCMCVCLKQSLSQVSATAFLA